MGSGLRRGVAAAILCAVGLGAGAARADTPAEAKSPGRAALENALPAAAKAQGVGGRAAARCKVSAAGVLSGCVVISEYPSAQGFGAALLSLVPEYQAKPATHDGQAVESTLVITGDWFVADKEPNWLRKPTALDLLAVYPREAYRRGENGLATIDCIVGLQGALFDCLTISETPAGHHFGDAALALTPQFLMRPATKDGKPVPSEVRIPINFKTFAGDPGPPSPVVSPAMVWAEAPTYADVLAAYPPNAKAARTGGRATLYCQFRMDGRLRGCEGVNDQPFGKGFHSAAQKLVEKFRAYPASSDGKGLRDASIQLPFTFDPSMLDGNNTVGRPLWAGLPSNDDVFAAFTGTPKNVGAVRVVLGCVVEQGGTVSGCKVLSENPAGKGFGQAALALSAKFKLSTWTAEGLPVVGGEVHIPIRFETDEPPAKP